MHVVGDISGNTIYHASTLGSYGKKLLVSVNQQKGLLSVWGS
jgi:hypothetical protein